LPLFPASRCPAADRSLSPPSFAQALVKERATVKHLNDEVRELRTKIIHLEKDVQTEQAAAASARLAVNDSASRLFKAETKIDELKAQLEKFRESKARRAAAAVPVAAVQPTTVDVTKAVGEGSDGGTRRTSISAWWGGARDPQVRV
jgi:septal ring factor EnvC (AmiA/AmiB activator)